MSYLLACRPETALWGRLPCRDTEPALRVPSGAVVVFDTVSHEGLVEDQGRDPVGFFGRYGVSRDNILPEAVALAASELHHDFDHDGPHVLLGPVHVEGAKPGDVLKVEILSVEPRVLYGVITSRQNKGVLVGEFPEGTAREEDACPAHPERYGSRFVFVPIEKKGSRWHGVIAEGDRTITFPLNPFLGTMGVTPDSAERWNSIPPTRVGGNIDINELGAGATLYLPVECEGALFFTGDPHFAQGDGEVCLTALEGSVRAALRLTVLPADHPGTPSIRPETGAALFAETETHWIIGGLNPDLNEAMKTAAREAVRFLSARFGLDRQTAYAYLSAATDFEASQVVDRNKGMHALIRKLDFRHFVTAVLRAGDRELAVEIVDDALYVSASAFFQALSIKYVEGADGTLTVATPVGSVVLRPDANRYQVGDVFVRLSFSPLYTSNGMLFPVCALQPALGIVVNWSTEGTVLVGRAAIPG